jgi:hypothetical protein
MSPAAAERRERPHARRIARPLRQLARAAELDAMGWNLNKGG